MKTFQDFEAAVDKIQFIRSAINDYRSSDEYKIALAADEYERQRNVTICEFVKYLYNSVGQQIVDYTASNSKIASNFFHRLNTQRCAYSLGNGVTFTEGTTKQKLGERFDTRLYTAAYYALIHGVSYIFWNYDQAYVFPMTQFCPLYDEFDGSLRAGIRFWSIDWNRKAATVVLYEEDGFTKYRSKPGSTGLDIAEYEPKHAYKQRVSSSVVDGEFVADEGNYSTLPIKQLWGSKHHQSTLVGMRESIDSYDLIMSGFCDDLRDCAEAYWLIGNALGMSDKDVAKFRDRLKFQHMAVADLDSSTVTPYKSEIPTNARETYLTSIRRQMYNDFGAFDVTEVTGGQKTATEINASYQPMDEEADDFEYQIIECAQQILELIGVKDTPKFLRNRIANQKEQTEMILLAADYLDEETILTKLPFVTNDEIKKILAARSNEEADLKNDEENQDDESAEE